VKTAPLSVSVRSGLPVPLENSILPAHSAAPTFGTPQAFLRYAGSAVKETPSSVEIGTYVIQLKHGDGAGISAVSPLPVTIELARPLPVRTLLHAPVTNSC
jgi:hypothetical protein